MPALSPSELKQDHNQGRRRQPDQRRKFVARSFRLRDFHPPDANLQSIGELHDCLASAALGPARGKLHPELTAPPGRKPLLRAGGRGRAPTSLHFHADSDQPAARRGPALRCEKDARSEVRNLDTQDRLCGTVHDRPGIDLPRRVSAAGDGNVGQLASRRRDEQGERRAGKPTPSVGFPPRSHAGQRFIVSGFRNDSRVSAPNASNVTSGALSYPPLATVSASPTARITR